MSMVVHYLLRIIPKAMQFLTCCAYYINHEKL